MIDGEEIGFEGDEPLELTEEVEDDEVPPVEDDEPEIVDEVVVGFADDDDDIDDDEAPPLVKKLRDQIRERDKKLAQYRRNPPANDAADPEPTIPARPTAEDYEYDPDRLKVAEDAYFAAKESHVEWKIRERDRVAARQRAQDDQAKQIEQQKRALGVGDYEDRAKTVKDALTDAQMAVLINGADDPAKMIYALGRSQTRLDALADESNLAKFAVKLGRMEKEIKVSKRKAPAPESRVSGATASISSSSARELDRLEKEAARTGDRTKIAEYRRRMKAA